ncbi:hypothetical protein CANCADRAFT_17020, partial [Tortispora caseinolytica NRRL Y-17796]
QYAHRLNMYDQIPTEEITTDEFEQWALDRLQVLVAVEGFINGRSMTKSEMETVLKQALDEYLPMSLTSNTAKQAKTQKERQKDHYSHYILRLAFCRSKELISRFVRAETMLFKMRFDMEERAEKSAFVHDMKFGWEVVDSEEKGRIQPFLEAVSGNTAHETFYKIEFEKVLDLVATRRVYLENGTGYVPESLQSSIAAEEFSKRLEFAMNITARLRKAADQDSRLEPVLKHISAGYNAIRAANASRKSAVEGDLTAESVEELKDNFPLCMSQILSHIRTRKHLKYDGRIQFNRFIKGMGVPVQEALEFWQKAFSTITEERFNKDYKYNFRHDYGDVGGRINFHPMSCVEILRLPPPVRDQSHGCPYRDMPPDILNMTLKSMGVQDTATLNSVQKSVEEKKYNVACATVYRNLHEGALTDALRENKLEQREINRFNPEVIMHPNEYFDLSYQTSKL